MPVRLSSILSAAFWVAIVLLAIQISTVSVMRYLAGVEAPPPPIVANDFADPFLAVHVVGGVIALLVGPFQLIQRIRALAPLLHRAMGRAYVAACAVAAPSGLILAFGTTAGPVAGAGFGLQAVLMALFTFLGLKAAIERRFAVHREWMLRSYALVAGAITLRLMLPAAMISGYDFFAAYVWIAWLCWTVNLAGVEYWIWRTRRRAPGFGIFASA